MQRPARCYQRQSERPTEPGAGPRQCQTRCSRRPIANAVVSTGGHVLAGVPSFFLTADRILPSAAAARYRRTQCHLVAEVQRDAVEACRRRNATSRQTDYLLQRERGFGTFLHVEAAAVIAAAVFLAGLERAPIVSRGSFLQPHA